MALQNFIYWYSTISELVDQIRIAQQISYEYCLRELIPEFQELRQERAGLDEDLYAAVRARMLLFARHSAQDLLRDSLLHISSGQQQLFVPVPSRSPFGVGGVGAGAGVGTSGAPSAAAGSIAPIQISMQPSQIPLPSNASPFSVSAQSQQRIPNGAPQVLSRVVVLEPASAREQRTQQQRSTGGLFKRLGFKKS